MKSSTKHDKVKVVMDANIVVSAILSEYGQPAQIVDKFINGKIENYTSKEIILELEDVFKRKEITERSLKKDRKFVLKYYKKFSITIKPSKTYNAVKEDPKDNKYIDCAAEAKAEYIISGDKHLLNLKEFSGIKIVKAKEFLGKRTED